MTKTVGSTGYAKQITVKLSTAEAQQLLWLAQSVADYEDALQATIPNPAQRAAAKRAIDKLNAAIALSR